MKKTGISKLPYRNNVASVTFKDGKFLVVHHPYWPENFWKFPQGGRDDDEPEDVALKRELLEELGTDKFKIITKSQHANQYDWSDDIVEKAGYRWRGQIQAFYLVEFVGNDQDILLDEEEVDSFKWVNKDELFTLIDHDDKNFFNYKNTIEKVLYEFQEYFN